MGIVNCVYCTNFTSWNDTVDCLIFSIMEIHRDTRVLHYFLIVKKNEKHMPGIVHHPPICRAFDQVSASCPPPPMTGC